MLFPNIALSLPCWQSQFIWASQQGRDWVMSGLCPTIGFSSPKIVHDYALVVRHFYPSYLRVFYMIKKDSTIKKQLKFCTRKFDQSKFIKLKSIGKFDLWIWWLKLFSRDMDWPFSMNKCTSFEKGAILWTTLLTFLLQLIWKIHPGEYLISTSPV